MKIEEMIAPCPKCGCKDKKINRRMIDTHRAHAELKSITCENCGYVFDDGENKKPEKIEEKHKIVNDFNQRIL